MVAAIADGFTVSGDDDGSGEVVVTVRGELDIASAPALTDAFDELAAAGTPVTAVDLRHVSFMDSSGLSALLLGARTMPAGSRLQLRNPSESVLRVLTLTGMLQTFDVLSDDRGSGA